MNVDDHFNQAVDMVRIGSGSFRKVNIFRLSRMACMIVAENDYNLNIPRYVDTFEEEEPIDIKAVMAEIKELEAKRAELDKEIEGYLKELGLVE